MSKMYECNVYIVGNVDGLSAKWRDLCNFYTCFKLTNDINKKISLNKYVFLS